MNVLGLANIYKVRPSTLFDIGDPYTAFCFDEACAWITSQLEEGKEPQFRRKVKSFKELYEQYQ